MSDDAANEFLLLGDVFEIDRRRYGDARVEEFFDVLIPFGVTAAGRIVIGKPVYQTDLRTAREDSGDIDDRNALPFDRGDDRQRAHHFGHFDGLLRLRRGDDDIFAARSPSPALVE